MMNIFYPLSAVSHSAYITFMEFLPMAMKQSEISTNVAFK